MMFSTSAFSQSGPDNAKEVNAVQSGVKAMKIAATPELFHLASSWVSDFRTLNPSLNVSIDQITDNNLQPAGHLTLVSDNNSSVVNDPAIWKLVVGRDVIVPVVNAGNPVLNLLNQQGVSSAKFMQLFNDPTKRSWINVVANGQNSPVNFVLSNDSDVKSVIEDFAKTSFIPGSARMVDNAVDVLAAVEKDLLAVGFCKLSDLRSSNPDQLTRIRLLPIDKNGNGRMDNFERIYANMDEFTHGVWIGKYPNALSKNIYALSMVKPTDENEIAFLSWIIDGGQTKLSANGYSALANIEKQSGIAALSNQKAYILSDVKTVSVPQSWPIFVTVILLVGLFAAIFAYSRKGADSAVPDQEIQIAPFLVENAMNVPKGIYFNKTHTWAFMEKDGNVKVGMDDFLQHITGKLTKIKMKEAGENVRKGEKIVTIIRDGKQLNLYAPISGTILAQNQSLLADSSLLNTSPYAEGWVYQIEPKNWLREVQFMLMGEKYTEWLQDEFVRLKDFITASLKADNLVYAQVVMQDGGELSDNVLADLGPEVWEDFQTKFIDTSR